MPVLNSLKPPFTQLFESVQDVGSDSVMNFFPDLVDDVYVWSVFSSVEIETYCKKELGLFNFPSFGNGGSDIMVKIPIG